MRKTARLTGLWRWGGYLLVPLAVWLTVVAALAGGLAWAQHGSERELRHRFELRVSIGAEFAANYVVDQLHRARRQAERFLSEPRVSEQRLWEVAGPFGYTAVVVLDDRGRLLQGVPTKPELLGTDLSSRYAHLRTAVQDGVPAVSRVVPSAARGVPLVAFAAPFRTPQGRRVFSGGLQVQDSPLGSYVGHAIALPSSRVYLVDPDGKVVASDRPLTDTLGAGDPTLAGALAGRTSGGYREGGQDWFYSAAPVAGTPWRIVAAVPTAVLYAPARDPGVWRATMVSGVALTGLLGVFGAARSRRSRRLLRESEQRFRDVFDNSLIGMAITAPTKQMLRVNPAFCAMLGYSQAHLLACTFSDITHPDDRSATEAAVADTIAGRINGFTAEKRYLHADGHSVHTTLTTSLLRDDTGAPLYFATQIVDVTARKVLEAAQEATNTQLREAHQRVADLVAMLSHDVRQPLGVITGYTDTVLGDWDVISDNRRRDFLARISAAARRMTILVEDILALTNLDAGTTQPRCATVDVVQAVTDTLSQLPGEQAATVTMSHPDHPALAVVDPGHLQQILLNLLGNAVKYGSAPIDVIVSAADDAVDVTVADHGEGVPEDFVPRLFERFTRATTGIAVTQKGTGLGLYIVAQLAHANQADVSYRRNEPGGASFTLHLVRAATRDPHRGPACASPREAGRALGGR